MQIEFISQSRSLLFLAYFMLTQVAFLNLKISPSGAINKKLFEISVNPSMSAAALI